MAAWRPWSISGGAMDGGAMDSASERGCESGCETDSSMPDLVSNSESPSDSSGDEPEPEPELPEPELLDPKPEPDPEPEPELLDPEPEPEPELLGSEPEPEPDLTLAEWVRGGTNEAVAGTATQLPANSWGAGLPSFWCAELAASTNQRQYLVREEHAAQFSEEFPDCAGGNILSLGRTVEKATLDAKLVTYEPPAGAIRNTQARRPQRFVNERVRLTDAGTADLGRSVRQNLIVWGFRYRCGGIDTYVCVSSTAISASPDSAAALVGRSIPSGVTVVAEETKTVGGKRWIKVGPGWACCVDTQTAAVKLRAAGCKRQCGGVCVCAATCTQQVKKRHECDFSIKFERTLSLVQQGLVRITVIGSHTPDRAAWAPMPLEGRRISVAARQEILKQQAQKKTAKQAMQQLNLDARQAGSPTDGRGAVVDTSVVPEKRKIQQLMTNRSRAGKNGKSAFEVVDSIVRYVVALVLTSWTFD